ncbi:hypothetical protein [Acinetobacter calcoaceticus]|uniref:hypothetical protein n=1 Tax=Acinetobacter calcoaceticus TaxID=471 RepID=UPI0022748FB7|nr:hypothetical protein [Acinetobacter calcoaceticus]GLG82592.1 hypothetical protein ACSO1_11140 [Acinetobacter calcoaceticus]
MKINTITLGIIACTLGASIYSYHLYAGKNPQLATDTVVQQKTVPSEKKDGRVVVKDLNNAQELFSTLYISVSENNLKNNEDLAKFNEAKNSEYKSTSYLKDVLTAYKYKGVKSYKNKGEDRYLVAFVHKDAEYSGHASVGTDLDLFLFKKSGEEYELIAKTSREGLVNGGSGNTGVDDMTYDHIMNSEPIDIGSQYKGFIVSQGFGGGGHSNKSAYIVLLDEKNKKIYDIANDISFAEEGWANNAEYKYDSFYFLDKSKESNGIYDLAVLYEGNKDIRKSFEDAPKIVPYNVYKTYKFDGKSYKLESEQPNPYSETINFDGYQNYFSKINNEGYAPIFYESVLKFVDDGFIDYWLSKGIRVYKPSEKTEEFFTWKVKGLKVHGLDVIGVQRGVCDISGENRCGYAGDTIVIFDASVDQARKVLKEKTFVDYANLSADQKGTYPYLDSIVFNGKKKAALYFLNENP